MAATYQDAWTETDTRKLFQREDWMTDASCVGHPNSEIFFTDREHASEYVIKARQVCADCPVWRNCLDFAISHSEEYGVWGGLTNRERIQVRRQNEVAKCIKCRLIRVFSEKAQTVCGPCRNAKKSPRLTQLG